MLLPLTLVLSLGAVPQAAACQGERLVLMPFEAVALTRAEARGTEEAVRRTLAKTEGVCLEPRSETVARLRSQAALREACTEAACRASEVKSLGAQWLMHGRVLGLGGERTVSLVLVGSEGQETRSTFPVPALEASAEEAVKKAFTPLWAARVPRSTSQVEKSRSAWPMVVLGTGVAALAAGVGFGMAAHSTQQRLSQGAGGCTGEGEDFRRCFARGLQRGERQSHLATGLLGAGAVLGAGAAVLFIWELP